MPWRLEIHHIGLHEEGDSTLIIMRHDQEAWTLLVDGGFEQAGADIWRYLTSKGVVRVNVMVATHPDRDHIGGLRHLLDYGFPTDVLVFPQEQDGYNNHEPDNEGLRLLQAAVNADVPIRGANGTWIARDILSGQGFDGAAPMNGVLPGLPAGAPKVYGLAADRWVPGPSRVGGTGTNERSIALLLDFGGFHYYLGGDLPKDSESSLVAQLRRRHSSPVYRTMKLSHHGSKESSPQGFLNEMRPGLAVASCGWNNQYGHPDDETLRRLHRAASECVLLCTGKALGVDEDDPVTGGPPMSKPDVSGFAELDRSGEPAVWQPGHVVFHVDEVELWLEWYPFNNGGRWQFVEVFP
ncbi:MAG: MBL fold metallo-hydrolase [Alphaproteobacteria bacterium]|nr:MBL fold metallo-hydrolase [Alphaproteobacteria bacterium]